MRRIFASFASTFVLATPTLADGCYVRHYSAGHLAAHPDQVVASMRVEIGVDERFGSLNGVMDVVAADQGHARAEGYGGRTFIQYLHCGDYNGAVQCGAECDSGFMIIRRKDDEVLEFTTRSLVMSDGGEGCSFTINLAEREREPTTYRLDRVADEACEGL